MSSIKEVICICCPCGCHLQVDPENDYNVTCLLYTSDAADE